MRKQIVSITLDPNDLKEVKKLAKKEDRSVSYVISIFIKEALRRPHSSVKIIQRAPSGRYAH